jgi:hypothetical protein
MITVRLSGGMGNQMFQYAAGRALALKYNVPLKLDTTFLLQRVSFPHFLRPHFVFRNYDLDVFAVVATIANSHDLKWWQRPILSGKIMLGIDALLRKIHFLRGWERSYGFDKNVLDLGPDAYLAGFWQSPKYFEAIRETLLLDFNLVHPLSASSETLKKEIQQTRAVCLHVRRGDISGKNFHGAVSKEYYDKAIAYISQKEPIEKIYVFSDDIEWCKNNLQFDIATMYVGPEYAGTKGEEHLALMMNCKHFIIPNSTFSWWAAWLCTNPEKMVVAPKQWFKDDIIDGNDLIPQEWVRL